MSKMKFEVGVHTYDADLYVKRLFDHEEEANARANTIAEALEIPREHVTVEEVEVDE